MWEHLGVSDILQLRAILKQSLVHIYFRIAGGLLPGELLKVGFLAPSYPQACLLPVAKFLYSRLEPFWG